MAYTEFCCRSGGSNLNAGTLTGDSTEPGTSPSYSYTGGSFSGNTFTVGSGNPQSDGVTAGMFVHCSDGAAIGRIARVSSVTTTTIVLDTTATIGSGTGATQALVGGAWAGPSGSTAFPFGTLTSVLTNSSGDYPRINFKNAASFLPTASMAHSGAGPVRWQGYTTSYGDGGKAIIDGGSASAFQVLNLTGSAHVLCDLIFTNDAASGTPVACFRNDASNLIIRCVFHDCRESGTYCNAGTSTYVECEAYNCNKANSSARAAFCGSQANQYIRCIAHDNTTGSNCHGFQAFGGATSRPVFIGCIADTNAGAGFYLNCDLLMQACDAYNNTLSGIDFYSSQTSNVYIASSNFTKNGAYGINRSSTSKLMGGYYNCGFGAGTEANSSGATSASLAGVQDFGTSVNYASNATPYVDAANGDFRITLSTAKGAGRGTFTQTASSYTGAVGYPDIGAAQHADAGGGGGLLSPNLRGGMAL